MNANGFELLDERDIPEVDGTARLWRHKECGAQLLSICNSDENKCFGANFYTPPHNSTGVAHILEHSVLCGSERFRVKEPFVELLKGSLQTFLNAFTFPDKTCYPVASANLADFYNLVDVYLDAVFRPLLTRDTFAQEGWHVEAASADAPWQFKGVVYNEMKGSYSSPDAVLGERSQQAVFPDNLYCLDSGGNPQDIPSLTYLAFLDFYQRFYQPGNARFFFWGDDPEEKRLEILAPWLEGHEKATGLPPVRLQTPYSAPRVVEAPYAAAPNDSRAFFTMNWLLGERGDTALALRMEMLEHVLEGLPGSPLRRALMESGLGEDSAGCGLETDLRQMYYSTGLKGIEPAAIPQAEQLVLDTLKDLVKNGIDRQAIHAAVNSVEFAYRENNSGRFPRGLAAMIQSLSTWLYGGDPLAPLAWEKPLADLKKAIDSGEKVFEQAIQKWFLDNPSRVRVSLLPDPRLGASRNEREKAVLAALREESSPLGRAEAAKETARLEEAQLRPDDPAELAKIPSLSLKDIPAKDTQIPCQVEHLPQTFLAHALPTRGIDYISCLLPIRRLPPRLLPYLPLFCRSIVEWGTKKMDYVQLGARIASRLGGFGASPLISVNLKSKQIGAWLSIGGKAVSSNLADFFDMAKETLLDPQDNTEIIRQRLAQMIGEEKARMEQAMQSAGHLAAALRVKARYRGEDAIAEQTVGISQLQWLRKLEKEFAESPEQVISAFTELRQLILGGDGAIINCAAEAAEMAAVEKLTKNFLEQLPKRPELDSGSSIADWPAIGDLPAAEVFQTPGQVNYVAKGANLYSLGYVYNGSAAVIMRWLRMGPLWEEVRVAGGAYGCFCQFDRLGGDFVCSSYRDPNVDRTLSAYDGLGAKLRAFNPGRPQLEQAIIGAIGDLDAYLLPDAKAAKSLIWHLAGLDAEMRQKRRDEMLGTTVDDFHAFADVLDAVAENGAICVLGGGGAAQAAAEHGWPLEQLV